MVGPRSWFLNSKVIDCSLRTSADSFYRIRMESCLEYYTVQVGGRIKVELKGSINLIDPCFKDT